MTPESRKMFNTWMGTLLILLAIALFGLSAYMIFVPAKEKPAPLPTVAAINKQPCIEGLTELGMSAVSVGPDIRVTDTRSTMDPQERLRQASLGISMCHLYLKSFCMGPACADPTTMSFVLTPDEPGKK